MQKKQVPAARSARPGSGQEYESVPGMPELVFKYQIARQQIQPSHQSGAFSSEGPADLQAARKLLHYDIV